MRLRSVVLAPLVAVVLASSAFAASQGSAPNGQYELYHSARNGGFIAGFVLHGHAINMVGVTTTLIACTRPPSPTVQFPGPPFNWQPQKTIPLTKVGGNLVFDYSGSFRDRVNGYPESMKLQGSITPAGTVTGKVEMQADDNTASTGEIKCQTRGFLSFSGKYTPGG
jgi:hypothetical protein